MILVHQFNWKLLRSGNYITQDALYMLLIQLYIFKGSSIRMYPL